MILTGKFAMNKNYIFIADSASFGNIYGEHSDSTGIRFSVKNEEAYGKLVLNITNFEGNRIIQLLSSEGEKVVKEVKMEKDGRVEFPLLEKGPTGFVSFMISIITGYGLPEISAQSVSEPVSYMPSESGY